MSAARARLLSLCLLSVACRRDPPREQPAPVASAAAAPSAAAALPWTVRRTRIDVATTRFRIVDAQMSRALDGPFLDPRARAVINAGFFDPKWKPLGLAISEGHTLSAFSPTMSGGVLWIRSGVAHLTASEEYNETAVDFAVQCRPRLVVAALRNIRSDDGKRAARTALCLRRGGAELEVVLTYTDRDAHDGPTLFELATTLQAEGCEEALALDGGPSTGGVLRTETREERVELRGPIRHAIVMTPTP